MKIALFVALVVVGLTGCNTAGDADVAACKRFLEAANCGSVDISGAFSCDSYQNTTCDISAYFDCAASHYVCKDGTYDMDKLAGFSADCGSLAVCN